MVVESGNPARFLFLLHESDAKLGSFDQSRFRSDRRSQGRVKNHRSRSHELHRLHQPKQHNATTTTNTMCSVRDTATTFAALPSVCRQSTSYKIVQRAPKLGRN